MFWMQNMFNQWNFYLGWLPYNFMFCLAIQNFMFCSFTCFRSIITQFVISSNRMKYLSFPLILDTGWKYSEVPLIRPPMTLVKSNLKSEQVLMRPLCIENCISILKQTVLIGMMILYFSGLCIGILL